MLLDIPSDKTLKPSPPSSTSYWRSWPSPRPCRPKSSCTFYSWSNNAEGLEYLRVLRNRLGYYRLCERTHGR